jgi:Ser/Thr protein kinase RdoA (MazF antagonist)
MSENIQDQQPHPYTELTPDRVMQAIETKGFCCDGSLLALNSYENRVYQVGIEDANPLIAKFYRPQRWADEAILEEHRFTLSLAELEIPVVAPLEIGGETLFRHAGFRFALYPRRGGHWPELEQPEHLRWMGRFIARIHNLGASKPFSARPTISIDSYGTESRNYLLENDFLPPDLETSYQTLVDDVLMLVRQRFAEAGQVSLIRLHGDCHPGNILWTDAGPHFVDFDDARMGPAIQDLWMLLSGERHEMEPQLQAVLEGYREFRSFDMRELQLIEPLRTLRMLHYSAWLARRWGDPAFPHNFPWFNTQQYWQEQILSLREQVAALQEPALSLELF